MPNRILREGILTSERIDGLPSWSTEVFYRRLMSVVDDFGRYYANSSLLRAACYPLKLDKVSNADIDKWLAECAGAGLVSTYDSGGRRYLQLIDFRQHRRAGASKFPQPPSECSADAVQMQCSGSANAHLDVDVCVDVCGSAPKSRKPKTPIPKDLAVSEQVAAWAKAHGHDRIEQHLEAFKQLAASKDYRYADWNAAFMRAVRENWAKLPPIAKDPLRADL